MKNFLLPLGAVALAVACVVPAPQPPAPPPVTDPPPPVEVLTCANMDCAPGFSCVESSSGPKCVKVSPPADACSLETPPWTQVRNPQFKIGPNGQRLDSTPWGCFGTEYCAKAGWTDGRSCCGAAPDGHPERVACEQQYMRTQCPVWTMSRCTGTSSQCPLTMHIAYFDKQQGKEVPYPANEPCPAQQNDQPTALTYTAVVNGKGYVKVCSGPGPAGEEPFCTEYPQEIDY